MRYIEKYINANRETIKTREKIGELKKEIGELKTKIGDYRYHINELSNSQRETPYYFVRNWINNNKPHLLNSFSDSLSDGQYVSKLWLVDELKKMRWHNHTHIEIIGGWFGYPLIEMLQSFINIKQIDFYEIDPECKEVLAQYVNHFKPYYEIKIFDDYFERLEKRRRQLIINTSSEHMIDIIEMRSCYKNNPTVAIQSNNYYEIEDHINCVDNEDMLAEKLKYKILLYKGNKRINNKFDRFMTIGRW